MLCTEDAELQATKQTFEESLAQYAKIFKDAYHRRFAAKLGVPARLAGPQTENLVADLLEIMAKDELDFTNSFLALEYGLRGEAQFAEETSALQGFKEKWLRLLAELEIAEADALKIDGADESGSRLPRNHQLETALRLAMAGDFKMFKDLYEQCSSPYLRNLDSCLAQPPGPGEDIAATFCGT